MRILIFSTAFLPAEAHGGVPFATFYLCRELARLGKEIKVFTSDRNGEWRLNVKKNSLSSFSNIPVIYFSTLPGPYLYMPFMRKIVQEEVNKTDIIISSGTLWNHAGWFADKVSRALKIPHIVYTHGLLDPWAFKFKAIRKRLFWHLQAKRILQRASEIIALTENEKGTIRQLGIHTPITVIPNGVDPVDLTDILERQDLEKIYPQLTRKRYLLFMGRIHQKKGLDILLPAFEQIVNDFNDIVLVLAGPIEKIYQNELNELLRKYKIVNKVVFAGMVAGKIKNGLLHYATGFALTSHSEGLPMAVLEALATGCPVIITHQCNIPEVSFANAGWVVSPDINEVSQSIKDLFKNIDKAKRKGQNGKKLISDIFSWKAIGEQTTDLLDKLFLQYCRTKTV